MLVSRWGILRAPTPVGFSMNKVCKLVQALCSLHNFLIDEACPSQLAADNFFLQVQGAVPLGEMNVPTQLLGGGHVSVEKTDHRRSHVRLYGNGDESNSSLPRELLHEQVVEQDLRRPA